MRKWWLPFSTNEAGELSLLRVDLTQSALNVNSWHPKKTARSGDAVLRRVNIDRESIRMGEKAFEGSRRWVSAQ